MNRVGIFAAVASLAIAWSFVGCSPPAITDAATGDAAGDVPSADRVDGGTGIPQLGFSPCAPVTDDAGAAVDAGIPGAECATATVPLDWSSTDEGTIRLAVRRLPARTQPARAQLWLVAGGPGLPGIAYEPEVPVFAQNLPDVDIYYPDHRGTGESSRLACPVGEAESSPGGYWLTVDEAIACSTDLTEQWGPGLAQFTTSNAARDLDALIGATRRDGQQTFVYGFSYGSYMVQRFLQIYPTVATGAVIEGILAPDLDETTADRDWNQVLHDLMNVCAADANCRSHFSTDPWTALQAAFAALESGTCGISAHRGTAGNMKIMMSNLLPTWQYRALIPAVIARILRCNTEDQTALVHLVDTLLPGLPVTRTLRLNSQALLQNIMLSEYWPVPPPEIQTIVNGTTGLYITSVLLGPRMIMDGWPVYPHDMYTGQWATTDIPMLMMSGALDPRTPITGARRVGDHFRGARQHFVEFPTATHGIASESSFAFMHGDPVKSCGRELLYQFIRAPEQAPDTSCVATIPPVSFDGEPDVVMHLFGTTSAW